MDCCSRTQTRISCSHTYVVDMHSYLLTRPAGASLELHCTKHQNSALSFLCHHVMVDIGSDDRIPGDYSMVCFGAVIVEPGLMRTFYARLRPNSDMFMPEALANSGFSRDQCLAIDSPGTVMESFAEWLKQNDMFVNFKHIRLNSGCRPRYFHAHRLAGSRVPEIDT